METKLTRADIQAALKVYQVLSPLMEAAVTELCGCPAYITSLITIPGMVVLTYKEYGEDVYGDLRIPFEDLYQALDDPAALRDMVHSADAREGAYSRMVDKLLKERQAITNHVNSLQSDRLALYQEIGSAVVYGFGYDTPLARLQSINLELSECASKLEGINHAIKEVQNG